MARRALPAARKAGDVEPHNSLDRDRPVEPAKLSNGGRAMITEAPGKKLELQERKKVLVVDDNEDALMLEKILFEEVGFNVCEAKNASGGIATARKEEPDVIVMDMRLPDMCGIEAAKILRQDKTTCCIPILFVTGSVMPGEIRDLEQAAISDSALISKPINTLTFAKDVNDFMKVRHMLDLTAKRAIIERLRVRS
jgi:two-component system cell cycle response regulator DivK